MSSSQLVTAIIPTRKGNAYISGAIQSIINQTYPHIDICIVNDNAPECNESRELMRIVDGFTHQATPPISTTLSSTPLSPPSPYHRNITVVQGPQKGPGIARDTGIRHAQSSFIAFLDDDDIWSDDTKIEKQIAFLHTHPHVRVTGTEYTRLVDEQEAHIKDISQPTTSQATYAQMLLRNPLMTSSVLMYRDTYIQAGGFTEMNLAEDYDLWLRIGRLAHTEHNDSSRSNNTKRSKHIGDVFPIANTPKTAITYTVRKRSASHTHAIRIAWIVLLLVLRHAFHYPHAILAITKAKLRILKAIVTR